MNPIELNTALTRRHFLQTSSMGLGAAALASLSGGLSQAAPTTLRYSGLPELPHLPQKAKRVIFLCMSGGPSHLETLDYKPKLMEMDGKPMPASVSAKPSRWRR